MSVDGSELVIKVQGKFDFSSLQSFRNAYEKFSTQPKQYTIDLKETEYLDSSALGMLLALRDFAGNDKAKIKIINCNNDIKKILTITRLDEIFELN